MKARTMTMIMISLAFLAGAAAGGCDGNGGGSAETDADVQVDGEEDIQQEETTTEHSLAIASPAEGAVLGGSFTVSFTWSEIPDSISVFMDGAPVGELTGGAADLTVDSTARTDGGHRLGATGTWGETQVEAEAVSITVHNLGPVIDTEGYRRFDIISGAEARIPVEITDAVGLASIEIFRSGEPIATIDTEPILPVFDSTVVEDSVLALMLRATDTAGLSTMSDELPVIVMNDGSIVEMTEAAVPGSEWDEWSVTIPENPAGLELDIKSHWTMPEKIARLFSVAVVESEGRWVTAYTVGEGECPHSGTVRKASSDNDGNGFHIIDLSATELGSPTFTAGGMWFNHIAQGNLSDHLNDTFTFRNVVILIPE
jgi:hypothetical protein